MVLAFDASRRTKSLRSLVVVVLIPPSLDVLDNLIQIRSSLPTRVRARPEEKSRVEQSRKSQHRERDRRRQRGDDRERVPNHRRALPSRFRERDQRKQPPRGGFRRIRGRREALDRRLRIIHFARPRARPPRRPRRRPSRTARRPRRGHRDRGEGRARDRRRHSNVDVRRSRIFRRAPTVAVCRHSVRRHVHTSRGTFWSHDSFSMHMTKMSCPVRFSRRRVSISTVDGVAISS